MRTFEWDAELENAANWYAALAQKPGWWDYARQQVQDLEAEDHGHWKGLRALTGEKIKASGFKPPKRNEVQVL
jgi:hypothetical protein